MKNSTRRRRIVALLSLAGFILPLLGLAAATSAPDAPDKPALPRVKISDLPAKVVLFNEPRPNLPPNQKGIFCVLREGGWRTAVFHDLPTAEAFRAKLTADKAATLTSSVIPRAWVAMMLQQSEIVIFDPVDPKLGGSVTVPEGPAADNPELATLEHEDQSDRNGWQAGKIDWTKVGPRDEARRAAVHQMIEHAQLKTGNDYFNAALIMQHGVSVDDYLLAHELAIVAVSKGNSNAIWLAAASEDRFLMKMGRSQRFGTQLSTPFEVDGALSDSFRELFNVPSIEDNRAEAKKLEENRPR
ncbi:MAG TPA: hypothetical protein VHD32_09300 [Candidatus Didemnitutus sp.]|nr:hypothetical protein [Candidatus Didemnitutus sp.]